MNECQNSIPMPRWAYVPGGEVEPDRAPLEQAKSYVPPRFDGCVPWRQAALLYGLVLNDSELYWESHEVLEAVWKAAPMNGADRIVLQALIQIANAGLKQRMGRNGAAERLVAHAQELLREFGARKDAADEESLAGHVGAEDVAQQLRRWVPGTKLYLIPAMFPGKLEQNCINGDQTRWTTTIKCIIMQDNPEEADGG